MFVLLPKRTSQLDLIAAVCAGWSDKLVQMPLNEQSWSHSQYSGIFLQSEKTPQI